MRRPAVIQQSLLERDRLNLNPPCSESAILDKCRVRRKVFVDHGPELEMSGQLPDSD
jgi:hypothetical protein